MVQNATAVVADDSEQMESRPITVAAVPAGHQYVERITATSDLLLLPDPPVAGAAAGEWWPPAILDPAWIDGIAPSRRSFTSTSEPSRSPRAI